MEEKDRTNHKKSRRISLAGVMVTVGAAAVLIAVILFARMITAGREDSASAKEIEAAFRESVPFAADTDEEQGSRAEEDADGDKNSAGDVLASLQIDGYSCLGLLQVTGKDLGWVIEDETGSGDILPRILSGTPTQGSCMILGADKPGIFGDLSKIAVGDEITFTDVYGTTTRFTVQTSGTIEESRMETTDLNLFCRKAFGRMYLVSCSKEEEQE